MSFDLDKMQAVIELGEVIRLQNDALERLVAFRKARPNVMMPNLAKMVEENLKENVQVLYKELNNINKPPEHQTRHICKECHMAFLTSLPGGICDECRARQGSDQPRAYVPYVASADEEADEAAEADEAETLKDDAAEPDAEITASSTGDEQAVADAYAALVDTPDEAEAESETEALMAEPKAINLPSDDTDIYLADGEEISEDSATLPAEDEEPRKAVETVPDHDASPRDPAEPAESRTDDEPVDESADEEEKA